MTIKHRLAGGFILAVALGAAGIAQASAPEPEAAQTLDSLPGASGAEPLAASQAEASGAFDQEDEPPLLFDDTVVHDLKLSFEGDDWLTRLGCQRPGGRPGEVEVPKTDIPADLEIGGERIARIGVRCKGNSSLGIANSKKPLNLTIDQFVEGQELWGFDVINLNNNWSDASQLREAIAFKLLAQYMPVPRFGFAKVSAQGQVLGFYTLVEQVDGTWADHWFPGDDGTVVRGDSPDRIVFNSSTLNWAGEDLAAYRRGYEVKGPTAAEDAGYIAVRELTRALDAPASAGGLGDADFARGIRTHLDVDSALWYIAGSNLTANLDSYYVGKNYYLYQSQRGGQFHAVTWDLGLGFGLFNFQVGGRPGQGGGTLNPATVDPFYQSADANRPLIRRLLAVPEYRADYLAHYRTLFHEAFTPEWIEEVGASYQALIREAVTAEVASQGNVSGSFSLAQFEANLREPITVTGGGPFGGGTRPGILSLVQERRDHLAGQPALAKPDLRLAQRILEPPAPRASEPVQVRIILEGADAVSAVELRYRDRAGAAEERLPMVAGAGGGWSAELPGQPAGRTVSYFFRVGLEDGRAAFLPQANLTGAFSYTVAGVELPLAEPGPLVINELLADNATTLADPAGEYDDWVEIYNRGSQPLSLAGLHLSDDPEDPWAYALPAINLAPGQHLLIWCDNDPEQGPDHAPFRLDKAGETLLLSDADAILDQVSFGEQATDLSLARETDGAEAWIACGLPSPGKTNRCQGAPPPAAIYLPVLRRD